MTGADEAIRRALSPSDARAYEALGREPSLIAEALGAFRSRHRLIAIGGWAGGFAAFGFTVAAGWQVWSAPDVREMLLWSGAGAVALVAVAMIKVWFFLEMQKNGLLREIKRLELQVASLIALQLRPERGAGD